MTRARASHLRISVTLAAAVLLVVASEARIEHWRDEATLTFSSPVLIPGTTLEPGTYVFTLREVRGLRHLIEVSDRRHVIVAVPQAVPVKRTAPGRSQIALFSSSDPPVRALKAWFHPESGYGHEFVYPEAQALFIAEHAKRPVLSVDTWNSDLARGTLRLLDPSGAAAEWRLTSSVTREWEAWNRARADARRR